MGHVVHHYKRGDGKAPRRVIGGVGGKARWTVTVMGDRTESFSSDAGDVLAALDSGVNRATQTPIAIKVRRR